MKPPICYICNKDFRNTISEGGLVTFTLSKKDQNYNKRFKEKGFVGHKASTEWFCKEHYKAAKKYSHLTLSQAKQKIQKANNFLKPASLLFYVLVILVFFILGMALTSVIGLADQTGIVGGAIIFMGGVYTAIIALGISLFMIHKVETNTIKKMNTIFGLLLLLTVFWFVYRIVLLGES